MTVGSLASGLGLNGRCGLRTGVTKIQRPPIFTPLGESPWNPSSALVMCTGRAARVARVNMGYLVRAPPGGAADCGLMNGLVKP